MPLRRELTRTFYRCLFAGITQKIRLYKRDPDQRQGEVRTYIIYNVHREPITQVGETIQDSMRSGDTTTWHIPRFELEQVGIHYLTAGDRIEDIDYGTGIWEPESPQPIHIKLFANYLDVACVRLKGGVTAG